ncbi:MAG: hypothetical protein M1819_007253 [Sarea resinae]|nr:MAG: hypothetical protein M1819_007253 [Sarea resinae]
MAEKPPAYGEAAREPTSEELGMSIAMAKMHIEDLCSELRFLQEKGSMSDEIQDQLSSLTAIIQAGSPKAPPPQETPAAPTTLADGILKDPLTFTVKELHTGTHVGHIVAVPGDSVVVYAWAKNREIAIGYNEMNNTAGSIPASILTKAESQSAGNLELLMATGCVEAGLGCLGYQPGDYVRVCIWHGGNPGGIGFNLVTQEIGKISGMFDFQKIE